MDWITACGILDVPPDASEQRIKEQRNYWLNVLHPDKTTGLPPRIKIKADKDFLEKKAAWEYLLTHGNRPASSPSGRAQEPPRERPASTPQNEPSSSPKSKPKPVVIPSNIVFEDMEPGQSKKASFVVDNTGGPFDILQVSNPKSWLKIIAKHYSSTAKGLPLKVEIEATGQDWGYRGTENIHVELDDVETTVTAEVHMKPKPKPASIDNNQEEPKKAKIGWWPIGIVVVLLLGLSRLVINNINSGCLNALSSTTSITSTTAQEHVTNGDTYVWAEKPEYDKAIAEYNKAIELNPKLVEAYCGLAWAYDSKKEYDKAMAECNKALEINPQYAPAFFVRGLVYGGKGEYKKSIIEYNRAIDLNPQYGVAYYARAIVYKYQGEYDKSEADFKKASELGFTPSK